MRYYSLSIASSSASKPIRLWESHLNNVVDPGALQIEYDAVIGPCGIPFGASTVRLHGIALQDLTQPQQYAGMTLELKAGMRAGLPLVRPAQAGIILKGLVYQCFGNWEGVNQTLDFVVLPGIYTSDNPGNFVLNWRAGTELSDALLQTLDVAYPNTPISINVSTNLVQNHDEIGIYDTLDQLAQVIGDISEGVFDNRVTIGVQAGKIIVYDTNYKPAPIQLAFTDFVGQPTWINVNTIQLKLVTRADLQMGSIVRMPEGLQNLPGFVTTTQTAYPSSIKYQTTFQNNFIVQELRQIGNFRAADATQWVTIVNCTTVR